MIAVCFSFLVNIYSCKKDQPDTTFPPGEKVVVILGSSTAFGIGANPVDSSWPNRLAARFIKDNKKIAVVNLAQSGFTTYNVLPTAIPGAMHRPEPDGNRNVMKALSYKPDLIIINLPSNDFENNYSDNEILTNYKKITEEIISMNVTFLITSTQPRNFFDFNKRKRLKLFNSKMNDEYPINFLDYYDNLSDASYNIKALFNCGDGIHLNNTGHEIIYEQLFKNKLLLEKTGY
jgi:acyl-CoA thioesterase I